MNRQIISKSITTANALLLVGITLAGITITTQVNAAIVTSGLVLELDANSGVTTDAFRNVSSWTDLSGNGHNASQSNIGNQPVLVNNVFNGHSAIRFNGEAVLALAGQVLTSQQYTIMSVVTDTATDTKWRGGEIFSNWDVSNSITSVFLGTINQNPRAVRFTDAIGGATDPVNFQVGVGTITDPTSPFILTGISDTDGASIRQNNNLIYVKPTPISTRNLSTTYVVGNQGLNLSEFWQGDIAEILVYNKALSQSELQQNLTFLNNKYFVAQPPVSVPEPSNVFGLGLVGLGLAATKMKGILSKKAKSPTDNHQEIDS